MCLGSELVPNLMNKLVSILLALRDVQSKTSDESADGRSA